MVVIMNKDPKNLDAKAVFDHFTSGTPKHLSAGLADIAPDVSQYILEFVFGAIYARDTLTDEEKCLTTITTLMAMGGCEAELDNHVNVAINVGVAPQKIVNILTQALPYAGFPRVINAINVAKRVFIARNVNFTPASKP